MYNLRVHSDAPKTARDPHVEPVGKPLKVPVLTVLMVAAQSRIEIECTM
jgi:hypothetical protein